MFSFALISCDSEDSSEDTDESCECEKDVQTMLNDVWVTSYLETIYIPSNGLNCSNHSDTTLIEMFSGGYGGPGNWVPANGGERWVILCPPPESNVINNPDTIPPPNPYTWDSSCHCRVTATYQIYNGFNWYDAGPSFGQDYVDWTACDDQDFIDQGTYVLYDYEIVEPDLYRHELHYRNYYLMTIDSVNFSGISSPSYDC